MKTRLLLNLVLACVVAALVMVVVFEPGKDKPKSNPLTTIEESGVEQFTLRNQEEIEFERKKGGWWLKSPFAAPANEIRVRQLLDIARSEADAEYPLAVEDLHKFELDRPKVTMTVGNQTILFGGSDPIDMRRYVQIGTTLYLVRDDFFHHLTAKAIDYVDKKLVPEGARITSISIPGLKASLGADGKWAAQPPPVADPAAVSAALLNAWQSARALDVQRWEKPSAGELVQIGFGDGTPPVEFVIVKREPELILGRTDLGLRYELVGDLSKQLLNEKSTAAETPPEPEDESDSDDHDHDAHDTEEVEDTEGGVTEDEMDATDEQSDPEPGEGPETETEDGEEGDEEPMD